MVAYTNQREGPSLVPDKRTGFEDLTLQQLLDVIESYDFECQDGPLRNAMPWHELRRRSKIGPV